MERRDDNLKRWCSDKLSQMMGNCFLPDSDIIMYILSIPSARDLEEFLREIFGDGKRNACLDFVSELKTERARMASRHNQAFVEEKKPPVLASRNAVGNQASFKVSAPEDTILASKPNLSTSTEFSPTFVKDNVKPFKRKQLKYVPLHNVDGQGDSMMLPGRHPCECLGQKHRLINNCMQCGRIVCQQEGSGPCIFCGNLVCSPEDQEVLSRNSKKSTKLRQKLLESLPGEKTQIVEDECGTEKEKKAMAHKEKLLEFDRTSARRTKVIDDEADYFSSSKWISAEDRKKLKEREDELLNKKYASRRSRKVKIDFAGRTVTEDVRNMNIYNADDEVVRSVANSSAIEPGSDTMVTSVDPRIKVPRPQFVADEQEKKAKAPGTSSSQQPLRVQDKEFLEMQDDGMCLSMHQPWASLLVCAIKKVEGRSWYSSHRGRLWIAAASKVPSADEIKAVEAQYQRLGIDEFPNDYPTGVLLGCVDVLDCLKNEDYRDKYPDNNEENDSSFVFICDNPKELMIKTPLKGQHKIWKLDSAVHNMVRRGVLVAG